MACHRPFYWPINFSLLAINSVVKSWLNKKTQNKFVLSVIVIESANKFCRPHKKSATLLTSHLRNSGVLKVAKTNKLSSLQSWSIVGWKYHFYSGFWVRKGLRVLGRAFFLSFNCFLMLYRAGARIASDKHKLKGSCFSCNLLEVWL